MKIDIQQPPIDDIFKGKKKYTIIFVSLLAVACVGIGIGGYAIISHNTNNSDLETLALIFFVAPAPIATYFGEKLQKYKRLILPQEQKLGTLRESHPEIDAYLNSVSKLKRRLIRAEYQACLDWVEDRSV